MKIYCIHNARIPTEKAHGWQICNMCESLADLGQAVELIVPSRDNPIKEDPFSYYNVKRNFKITYVSSYDFLKFVKLFGKYSFYIQSMLFLRKLAKTRIDPSGVVITRNPEIAQYYTKKARAVFYEAHNWPSSKVQFFKKMIAGTNGIICNSFGTAEVFRANGFDNCLAAPNGVDLEKFNINNDKQYWRQKLNLPANARIVMYVGHLYEWKGAQVVVRAAKEAQDREDLIFVLLGGTEADIARYMSIIKEEGLNNILLLGHKQAKDLPGYMKAADILLLPNVPTTRESEIYTSPIKMFEYMASGRPIIASSLPSIREVLKDTNSVLILPDSVKELLNAVEDLFANPGKQQAISNQALRDVQKYTWKKRAEKIINFIKK